MNNTAENNIVPANQNSTEALAAPATPAPLSLVGVPAAAQGLLLRMFADPRVLAKAEKAELVDQLRECVALHPKVSDLRVVYGMALSVNLDAQDAMEELGEAVALEPEQFHRSFEDGRAVDATCVCAEGRESHAPGGAAGAKHGAIGNGAPTGGDASRDDARRSGTRRLQDAVALAGPAAAAVEAEPGRSRGPGNGGRRLTMSSALQLALLIAILIPAVKLPVLSVAVLESRRSWASCWSASVLGPGAVNLLHWQLFEGGQATSALLLLAQVGALVLMFIAGIETDIDRMKEASVTAFVVALSGVIWPFFLGAESAICSGFRGRRRVSWAAR